MGRFLMLTDYEGLELSPDPPAMEAMKALYRRSPIVPAHVVITDHAVILHDTINCGGGLTFLLMTWLSLYHFGSTPPLGHGINNLDRTNRDAFLDMLNAYVDTLGARS